MRNRIKKENVMTITEDDVWHHQITGAWYKVMAKSHPKANTKNSM